MPPDFAIVVEEEAIPSATEASGNRAKGEWLENGAPTPVKTEAKTRAKMERGIWSGGSEFVLEQNSKLSNQNACLSFYLS